jgi:hypothetical protein
MLQILIHLQYNVRVHAQKNICVTLVATIAKTTNFLIIAHNIGHIIVFQMFNLEDVIFTLLVAY